MSVPVTCVLDRVYKRLNEGTEPGALWCCTPNIHVLEYNGCV